MFSPYDITNPTYALPFWAMQAVIIAVQTIPDEIVDLASALADTSCVVSFLLVIVYITKWVTPMTERLIESHDKRIEQLLEIIEKGLTQKQD